MHRVLGRRWRKIAVTGREAGRLSRSKRLPGADASGWHVRLGPLVQQLHSHVLHGRDCQGNLAGSVIQGSLARVPYAVL